MYSLIIVVISSIVFSYFATLNTKTVSLSLGYTTIQNIPMYLVVLASLLIGLLLAGLINSIHSFYTNIKINAKNKKIAENKDTIGELTKRLHQLEIENTELKTKHGSTEDPNAL
jgi:uncharacterized integral membrane protein